MNLLNCETVVFFLHSPVLLLLPLLLLLLTATATAAATATATDTLTTATAACYLLELYVFLMVGSMETPGSGRVPARPECPAQPRGPAAALRHCSPAALQPCNPVAQPGVCFLVFRGMETTGSGRTPARSRKLDLFPLPNSSLAKMDLQKLCVFLMFGGMEKTFPSLIRLGKISPYQPPT